MSTIHLSLPDPLKRFVDVQVQTDGHNTASEYICALIRADQQSKLEQRLTGLLVEGLESGPPRNMRK